MSLAEVIFCCFFADFFVYCATGKEMSQLLND